jgi:hypothetical protein
MVGTPNRMICCDQYARLSYRMISLIVYSNTAIAASRGKNSPLIASRAHEFTQIFAANSPATDLVILGKFLIGYKDGNSVEVDFTARFILATGEDEGRLKHVEVWTDSTASRAALEKAKETLGAAENSSQ